MPSPLRADSDAAPEVQRQGSLRVVRYETGIMLNWELPTGTVRGLELYRNSESRTEGRDRIRKCPVDELFYIDMVDDTSKPHWYWLKVTMMDGRVINIGPVSNAAVPDLPGLSS